MKSIDNFREIKWGQTGLTLVSVETISPVRREGRDLLQRLCVMKIILLLLLSLVSTIASAGKDRTMILDVPRDTKFSTKQFVHDINHAKSLFAAGKQQDAIAYWENLAAKYGKAEGHYENELGNFYSHAGMHDQAAKAFLDGIALKTAFPRLYIGLAFTYVDQRRFTEAEKWATRAVQEFPNWWLGYTTLGQLEWRRNNFTQAKLWLERSLKVEPQPLTYWLRSFVAFDLKDPQLAVESMETAINLNPSYLRNEEGMLVSAVSLAQVGRFRDAYNAVALLKKHNPSVNQESIKRVMDEIKRLENKAMRQ